MTLKLHSPMRLLLGALSLIAGTALAQTTINVGPGQAYTTIQSGINAANNGDTVLVAPGTYNENINFNGKAITVTSSGGAAVTIIDGGNKPGQATVVFANGETRSSVISGFTITGGGDTISSGNSDGGVFVNSASPTIQSNTVTANYCHDIDVEFGAAAILNNEVSGNLTGTGSGADQSYCTFESGVTLGGTSSYVNGLGSVVIGNTIEDNTGKEPYNVSGIEGGALSLWAAQNVLIMNNTIRNNSASFPGSAFVSANSTGTVIAQNLIYGNSGCAGAIAPENGGLSASSPQILIANNVLANNTATEINADDSACIAIAQIYPAPYSYGSSGPGVVIVNNIVAGSTSYPAVDCSWFQTPSLSIQPTFENNILYNAGGPFFGSYCVDVSTQDGNIAADPQFVNAAANDYHLQSTSPAIDSGLNSAIQTFQTMTGMNWTTDFDGKPRIQNGSGNGCIIDMGAYEYQSATNSCGVAETLTSSLNPATAGQSVTFTAQLSATSGVPTGDVQFFDGTTLLSTQAVSNTGSASFSTSSLTVGSHTITANYQPTGSFGAGSASLIEVINGIATGTTLTCLPNPVYVVGTAKFTATVTSTGGTPTGSVSFTDNGAALGTQSLVAGAAVFNYSGEAVGTHAIVATYAPVGSFASSSATCSEVVDAVPTTSTLVAAPSPSTFGGNVTLSATVVPSIPLSGPSTPTGVVTFYNGAAMIGSSSLAGGVATLSTNSLPGGSDNLTCAYGGSSIYSSSNCNPTPIVVNAAPTLLTLSSNANPAIYGSSVAFTAHLTANGQSAGAGNTIQFTFNGQVISLITDATGSATYYPNGAPIPGSYPVSAVFAGNNNILGSSASLTEVITPAPTSIGLSAAPNPGNIGQSVSLTATVSSQSLSTLVGSGSVSFYDGFTLLGSAAVTANTPPITGSGTATLAATFSSVGVHNLTAVFVPNADFLGSTSAVFQETLIAGDFSIGVAPATASVYTGQSTVSQISVTSLNGFSQSLALSCSGLPANTTCSFSSESLPNGQGVAKLTIQTSAPAQTAPASVTLFGLLVLLLLPGRERRRSLFAACLGLLLILSAGLGLSGCGSPNPVSGGTPPGTYAISVNATTTGSSPTLAHSAVVSLTVKSLF
jgi:hypothetical protein